MVSVIGCNWIGEPGLGLRFPSRLFSVSSPATSTFIAWPHTNLFLQSTFRGRSEPRRSRKVLHTWFRNYRILFSMADDCCGSHFPEVSRFSQPSGNETNTNR